MVSGERPAICRRSPPTVSIPCLRKDFTVDEYMIYEAKVLGAVGSASDLLPF